MHGGSVLGGQSLRGTRPHWDPEGGGVKPQPVFIAAVAIAQPVVEALLKDIHDTDRRTVHCILCDGPRGQPAGEALFARHPAGRHGSDSRDGNLMLEVAHVARDRQHQALGFSVEFCYQSAASRQDARLRPFGYLILDPACLPPNAVSRSRVSLRIVQTVLHSCPHFYEAMDFTPGRVGWRRRHHGGGWRMAAYPVAHYRTAGGPVYGRCVFSYATNPAMIQ